MAGIVPSTEVQQASTSGIWHYDAVEAVPRFAGLGASQALPLQFMAIVMLFALGVVNFAMHKAVLESGHPMVARTTVWSGLMGGRLGFAIEFIVLLGAMLMVDAGAQGWAWAYLVYSLLNAASAWLILTGRI